MERARGGDISAARAQLMHTLGLIRDLDPPAEFGAISQELLRQVAENLAHVAEVVRGLDDPPLDFDALERPLFWTRGPADALATARTASENTIDTPQLQRSPRSFDESVDEIITEVLAGRVAVHFGAGISIASGIPGASELRRALLGKLPASAREQEWLATCDLPFEAFMGALLQETERAPLLAVFSIGGPNAAHHVLARLVGLGLVKGLSTTNFDEHLEQALREQGVAHRAVWTSGELAHSSSTIPVTLVKLHGTVSDAVSLALTMDKVAASVPVAGRSRAVHQIFAEGHHDTVLVLGYSCSDLFDVSPQIESLRDKVKRVHVVDHTVGSARAEGVSLKLNRNPFRACRQGTRLSCDTEVFLARLAHAAGIACTPPAPPKAGDWRSCVNRWWDSIPRQERSRVGHKVLGVLWYECGDYRAAKLHFRAALAAIGPRGEPANRASNLMRVAGCHRALSEYRHSEKSIRAAAAISRSEPRSGHIDVLDPVSVANNLFNTGRIQEALRLYQEAVTSAREGAYGGRTSDLGIALANLGNACGASEELTRALACFEEAIEIARELGEKKAEGARLGGIGQVYRKMKRLTEAEAAHRESMEIAKSVGDPVGVAMQLGSLAQISAARGQIDEALNQGVEAAALFHDLGDRQGEARALGNVGIDCLTDHRLKGAIHFLVASIETAAGIGEGTVFEIARTNLEQFLRLAKACGAPESLLHEATEKLARVNLGAAPDTAELLRRAFSALLPHCGTPRPT